MPAKPQRHSIAWWRRKPVLAWALYDWANSAFSLTVVTAFVPLLLADYWNDGAVAGVTTFRLGLANGSASLIVALLVPLLGAVADRAGRRKQILLAFTSLGIAATGGLALASAGQWVLALACFVVASVGFAVSNSLYDSLLTEVSSPTHYDQVSAYGFGLGYIGGALLFTLNAAMVATPQSFGLANSAQAVRISFLMVALWWCVFTLPLVFWVREPAVARHDTIEALRDGWTELRATLAGLKQQRDLCLFLLAYWLYIDGVYTIIKMAVDFGLALGLSSQNLILAILLTNYVGFPAALCFGWLGRYMGPRVGLYIALAVYIVATLAAGFIASMTGFYLLAICIGLVQGGVQSLSRSMYARMIPAGKTGEYFGFYNMLGKFAAILGPIMVGVLALLSGSQRIGLLSIVVLLVLGLVLLTRVNLPARGAVAGSS